MKTDHTRIRKSTFRVLQKSTENTEYRIQKSSIYAIRNVKIFA